MYDVFAENIVQELMQNAHGDVQTRTDRLARVLIDLEFKNIKSFTCFPETVNFAENVTRKSLCNGVPPPTEKSSPDKCIFFFFEKHFFDHFEYTAFHRS